MSWRERIVQTLRAADCDIPFYRGKFSAFLQAQESLSDEAFREAYRALPVTTKADLIAFNQDFLPLSFAGKFDLLTGGRTPSLWRAVWHGVIRRDFFASLSTGGTSGRSTFRWVDDADANSFAQSFLHSFHLNGWRRGESFVVFYPLHSYFTGVYADHAKALDAVFGFTMVPFGELSLERVEVLLEALRAKRSTLLVIFPCVLQRVAELMKAHDIAPFEGLACINVSGEFFLDCSKAFVEEMFPGAVIESTYGSVEFGEIAHQAGESSFDYEVFSEYAYVEQGPKVEGADTMLVTALRQPAFPLIRYRIEDRAEIVSAADGRQYLMGLEGKNTDFLVGADGEAYYARFFNGVVNTVNAQMGGVIIHFMVRHDGARMRMHFVLRARDEGVEAQVEEMVRARVEAVFANYESITVQFPAFFEHDYTRKFKIIGEGDGLAEVVGGYYQRAAP